MEKSRIDLPIGITLDRFIKSNENQYPNAAGELSQLLRDIALASKVVNREINKAGLIDIMGNMGQQNLGGVLIVGLFPNNHIYFPILPNLSGISNTSIFFR